ncbi:glycoside hydrolase family 2 protein [Amycolatopsis jiangsuensis]|uniref:Beta-galactosidase/beta-glucuronidase n=1 Tax=Amycolatopsis jiangsuensis TaxID=1181879 RepID=A0A840J802_9PSEU|nr:sugar-binding domain-containing protein [Amycolatopsis jiangsuensis]MBB4689507.1 beta-galactosidase/beta-glucuronidase [Amycolatopsis jiangsuensis]
MTDPVHPRPQLVREHWTDLCGQWEFGYDDTDEGRDGHWWRGRDAFSRTITVPFPPESPASGIGDRGEHPILWYRREFRVAAKPGERVLLHFGAVDYRATVWVNGHVVTTHEGGHVGFHADITAALRPADEDQVVVVRAEDEPRDPTQPRGKQHSDDAPTDIWYHRTSGIWQPVWLETVPARHIEALRWTPDVPDGSVALRLRARVKRNESAAVRVVLRLGEETLADSTFRLPEGGELTERIAIPAARDSRSGGRLLWSPEHPALVDAEITLLSEGAGADSVRSYFGLREVGTSDGHFLLNGRPYFLRMVLEQGYWPQSQLTAPSGEALREEVELIKSLGFNGVRIHQKVEDSRFLYWCDRLGLAVWGEMPSSFAFSPSAIDRFSREWTEVLERDASHPSIVTWVPVNESWGVSEVATRRDQQDYVAALYRLTRALDPSRPVISNDGWEHVSSDIWTVHDYAPAGDVLRRRYADPAAINDVLRTIRPGGRRLHLGDVRRDGQPIMLSEYGGVSYAPGDELWYNYSTAASADDLVERYRDLTTALLDCAAVAGFCYTQLTDTEQETNGLLTAAREPKADPAVLREITARPARSVAAELLGLDTPER